MAKKKPGVYDHILPHLPRMEMRDATRQDAIDALKKVIRERSPQAPSMGKRFKELRAEQSRLMDELSEVNLELAAYTQLLVDSQTDGAEGWGQYGGSKNTLRLITGDVIRVQPEPYTTIVDQEALRRFFIAEGLENLLTPHPQTVNANNKERLLHGQPELPGTKVWCKPKIVFVEDKPEIPRAEVNPNDPFADLF
jgi:hypothetical protein